MCSSYWTRGANYEQSDLWTQLFLKWFGSGIGLRETNKQAPEQPTTTTKKQTQTKTTNKPHNQTKKISAGVVETWGTSK